MKKVIIMGGGTFSHVRNHLSLSVPAFGKTAKKLNKLSIDRFKSSDIKLYLTKMCDGVSDLITNQDVEIKVDEIINDLDTKVIFFNVAMCDYTGHIEEKSGKYEERLKTSEGTKTMTLVPQSKVIKKIREKRKDIFLVAFKTTCGATEQEQYLAGLNLLKKNSCNLVLANDTKTRMNMIITPEEARYCVTDNRKKVLKELVKMTYLRSQLTFTRSTVINGKLIPWESKEVFPALRKVVDYCILKNAYKPFNGATVGHFACKINEREYLTSVRKSNFNDLSKNGLVKIISDGDDSVIAYGAKPSVGGQSQRIVYNDHPEYDCIVHFHCPIKKNSNVPIISQKEYECGSHECGQNTSNGLKKFNIEENELSAVMLDNHGPNIVFHHTVDPQIIINFIENNFDLSSKTGGLVS